MLSIWFEFRTAAFTDTVQKQIDLSHVVTAMGNTWQIYFESESEIVYFFQIHCNSHNK